MTFAPARRLPRLLEVVGSILVLSVLTDYIIYLLPFDFASSDWKLGLLQTLVDRGIVPLVGLTLIFVGQWWRQQNGEGAPVWEAPLRLVARFAAVLLAVVFALTIIFGFFNLDAARAKVDQQLQQQIKMQIEPQLNQVTSQLDQMTPEQLKQQLEQGKASGQLPPELLKDYDQLQKNPTQLKERLKAQLEQQKQMAITQMKAAAAPQMEKAQADFLRQVVKNTLMSLLLATGYAVVFWTTRPSAD